MSDFQIRAADAETGETDCAAAQDRRVEVETGKERVEVETGKEGGGEGGSVTVTGEGPASGEVPPYILKNITTAQLVLYSPFSPRHKAHCFSISSTEIRDRHFKFPLLQ